MLRAINNWDVKCFEKLNHIQTFRFSSAFFRIVSFTGDGYIYAAVGVYLFWASAHNYTSSLSTSLMAFLLDLPSFMLLKKIFKRPRPCVILSHCKHALEPRDQFSMPSGHAAAAALMACQLSHFYPQVKLISYTWALLIGLSRVLLGVHYPMDVLFGFVLGICCSKISLFLWV
ncbi:MAG: phosphatase PAP2 family protein [Pseudomonadota bacterium]|nr:phosphatase PAP2 family protein [Pseudomonadota bacterium]